MDVLPVLHHFKRIPCKGRENSGAHDGTRIRDLFLTKEVLYRLSYMGTGNRTRRDYVQFHPSSKYAGLSDRFFALSIPLPTPNYLDPDRKP